MWRVYVHVGRIERSHSGYQVSFSFFPLVCMFIFSVYTHVQFGVSLTDDR